MVLITPKGSHEVLSSTFRLSIRTQAGIDLVAQGIICRALRDIRAGEELYVELKSRFSLSKQILKPALRFGFSMFQGSITPIKRQRRFPK